MNLYSNMTQPALPPNMGMDIDNFISSNVNNYNNMRDYILTSNKNSSRTVSMSLSKVSVDYATKIEWLNDISDKVAFKKPINSLQLSYAKEKKIQVSKTTNHNNRRCLQ